MIPFSAENRIIVGVMLYCLKFRKIRYIILRLHDHLY